MGADSAGCRSRWLGSLRPRSAATRLLVLRVRIPLSAWVFVLVFFVCCVGSDLCHELITRPEESYRVCLILCNLKTSTNVCPKSDLGCCTTKIAPRRLYFVRCCLMFVGLR